MLPSTKTHFTLLATLFMGGAMIGCKTTSPTADRKKSENLTEAVTIQRGTSAAAVIGLLGEPDQKKPVERPDIEAEIWIYQRSIVTGAEEVITGTENSYYYDRNIKNVVTVEVPVTEMQLNQNDEVTEILLIDGQVHNWKRHTAETNEISGQSR